MLSKLGLRATTIASLVSRLSSGTLGRENVGAQIDADITGVSITFNAASLALNPQTLAGTEVVQMLMTDTIGTIAAPTGYLVKGNKSVFRLRASDTTTGAVSATSGIAPYLPAYPAVRGALVMQHADFDGATAIVLDQIGFGVLPGVLASGKNAWKVSFEIADWKNKTALRAVALAELGIAFGAVNIDPATALSASQFACFELSEGQIRFKTATYTGEFVSAPSPKDFELEIGFDCATGIVVGYLEGKKIGQTTLTATGTAQIAARTMHKTAYVAATARHEPIGLIIDSIQASIPLVEA